MKFLVVDDSPTIRRLVRRELEAGGHEVREAADGESGLALIFAERPDLLTLDVDMPDQDGFEVCRRLREWEAQTGSLAPLPVVFLTGNESLIERERGFEVGAADFVHKNDPRLKNEGELRTRLEAILKPPADLSGLRALVVDDNLTTRHIIAGLLRGERLEVTEAADGREAYDLAAAAPAPFDLVVTDCVMPNLDGEGLCRRLRRNLGWTEVPVIFLSALAEKSRILSMFQAGGTDYLMKPFAKEELLARIRVHLETRRLTRELRARVEELHRLNKQKDDFLAVASHDLRSPLTGILGFTELICLDRALNPEHRTFLGHIRTSGEFLLSLINDVLDLARIQAEGRELERRPVDVAEVAADTVRTLRHMATPKEIEVSLLDRHQASRPIVGGDRSALLRVCNNLVSNAIKFTPRGGQVTVTIEPGAAGAVVLAVTDTGMGIPPEQIAHLFDRFSKASRRGTAGEASTGLGLAITKELVDRHGGRIEVRSQVGAGSVFRVSLPPTAG